MNAKYTALLTPDHDANGLMETKFLVAQTDARAVADRTEGRMKAGIELSVDELNKLLPLWDGAAVLDAQGSRRSRPPRSRRATGSEPCRDQAQGRAGERGHRLGRAGLQARSSSRSAPSDARRRRGQVTAVARRRCGSRCRSRRASSGSSRPT